MIRGSVLRRWMGGRGCALGTLGGAGEGFWCCRLAQVNAELGQAADRRAWFVAALCLGSGRICILRRSSAGWTAPRSGRRAGTLGFGYDPMFVPGSGTETFGEMTREAKHAVSHRARAFAQLLVACLG